MRPLMFSIALLVLVVPVVIVFADEPFKDIEQKAIKIIRIQFDAKFEMNKDRLICVCSGTICKNLLSID